MKLPAAALAIVISLWNMVQASAQNNDTVSWSVAPSLNSGIFGITDCSISPLEYWGPISGISILATAETDRSRFIIEADGSYGWPGNDYHRDSKAMRDIYSSMELGYDRCIFSNGSISVRAGGSAGAIMNGYENLLFIRNNVTYAFDARARLSADIMMSSGRSLFIEERLPVMSYMSDVRNYMYGIPLSRPDFSLAAFPGNDLNMGFRHEFSGGDIIQFSIRHKYYASRQCISQRFRIRSLELCAAYCFRIRHGR